ncbi:putative membrane protein [Weissella uvarum]|uniref:DUF2273 domain-containing protein n=1 Tax=Weissella uvarum TaxID=1479233 RepID=UPI001EF98BE0|nr:DUF2273 domain-containing protein [Weissella uvarum]MBM7617008.1 putative membrane protein [Weissella uvarum]
MDTIKQVWSAYRWPIIGGIIGLIVAILFLEFGFWKTMLVVVLVAAGVAGGLYLQAQGYFGDRRQDDDPRL